MGLYYTAVEIGDTLCILMSALNGGHGQLSSVSLLLLLRKSSRQIVNSLVKV